MKKKVFSFLICLITSLNFCFANETELEEGKSYTLFFDNAIENIKNENDKILRISQIFNIYNKEAQIVVEALKTGQSTFNITTAKKNYEYKINVKKSTINTDPNFIVVDLPCVPYSIDLPPKFKEVKKK